MRRFLVLSTLLLVAGCNEDGGPDACNAEHITTVPMTGNTGLVLEPSEGAFLTFDQIETTYLDVEQCTGLSAAGPRVAFISFAKLGMGSPSPLGAYSAGARKVTINTDPPVDGIANDCELQRQVLRHEFVHHLLGEAGVWGLENAGHASPLFDQCARVVTSTH